MLKTISNLELKIICFNFFWLVNDHNVYHSVFYAKERYIKKNIYFPRVSSELLSTDLTLTGPADKETESKFVFNFQNWTELEIKRWSFQIFYEQTQTFPDVSRKLEIEQNLDDFRRVFPTFWLFSLPKFPMLQN